MSEWQPIGTAPKDGSPIILCSIISEDSTDWDGGAAIMVGNFDGSEFSVRTGMEFSNMSYVTKLVCQWTHWMHLPELPS